MSEDHQVQITNMSGGYVLGHGLKAECLTCGKTKRGLSGVEAADFERMHSAPHREGATFPRRVW